MIGENFRAQMERIARAASDAGREADEIRLEMAVKYQSVERISAAIAAGGTLMGHNLAQQLRDTIPPLLDSPAANPAIDVHFIGHLQSNKINQVLPWISTLESLDSLRLATRLSQAIERLRARQQSEALPAAPFSPVADPDTPLDVYLQVNTSGEESKFGVHPDAALDLAGEITALPNVRLAGWMTIGAHVDDTAAIAASFASLRRLREAAHTQGILCGSDGCELSMGMTADLPIAIAEGATIVRIGTAIFGPRPKK